jgi:hypothetical protein
MNSLDRLSSWVNFVLVFNSFDRREIYLRTVCLSIHEIRSKRMLFVKPCMNIWTLAILHFDIIEIHLINYINVGTM